MNPTQIAALPDYTDAELLKVYRHGFAQGWWGVSKVIDGRTWTFGSHDEMLNVIERLEKRIADDADGADGNTALAKFGRAR